MTAESSVPRVTDTITVLEGFDAMRVFLEVIWQRQDRTSHEIGFVLGGSRWVDGSLADPTIWEDWLVAIRMSRRRAKGSTILSTTMHRAHRAACIEMQDRDRVPIAYAPFCAGEPGLNGIEAASSLRKGWVNENVSDP